MRNIKLYSIIILLAIAFQSKGQEAPTHFSNPILSGFNPDPSICRVDDDYYLVTSSFTWYPGIPVYHSKDLVNWELIGHGLVRPNMVKMEGLNDNDGIWAPTIRYYDGLYYIITTASKSGGNFYITATDPKGPWSDPVWLKDAPGIDPSLFWDDDGRCYYTGNFWDFKKSWPGHCAVWVQELDLKNKKFVGERRFLTYGHANNAANTEGPHLYKINGKYVLITGEGGTDYYHAVTVHQSDSLWGPYISNKINPILSHRQLGSSYPIQAVGHADFVQTQNGEWYSVVLGKRVIDGHNPLARETFLCKIVFENSTPIYNPGYGVVLPKQKRPDLPWTPVKEEPVRDNFDLEDLGAKWHFVRVPLKKYYKADGNGLNITLQPEVIDSLKNSAMIIQRIKQHQFSGLTKLNFQAKKENEEAGLVVYRTANAYYTLMKGKSEIVLTKKHLGNKEVVQRMPYNRKEVYLKVDGDGLDVKFSFGESPDDMATIGGTQKLDVISDNKLNRFNGSGIGVYVTSNGNSSTNNANFAWFEYRDTE